MSTSDLPWPKKGDKLFAAAPAGRNFMGGFVHYGPSYATSFKEAADIVVNSLEQDTQGSYRDDLLHPVAYLYRHALEVKLKEIVQCGVQMHCYEKSDVEQILGAHNLAKLWTKARQAIEHRWPKGGVNEIKAAEAILNEMHQTDKDGQQ